jgi:hypothetical protein
MVPTLKNTKGKGNNGHSDIVYGNSQKRANSATTFINGHRFAVFNIFNGHVHIIITQNQSHIKSHHLVLRLLRLITADINIKKAYSNVLVLPKKNGNSSRQNEIILFRDSRFVI